MAPALRLCGGGGCGSKSAASADTTKYGVSLSAPQTVDVDIRPEMRQPTAEEGKAARFLAAQRDKLGDKHPDTLVAINNLAMQLKMQGKLDSAAPLYREALTAQRETLGNRHADTLISMNNLAMLQREQGDLDGAAALMREVLAARRETLGDRHPDTLISINNLASLLHAQHDLKAAAPLMREALTARSETLGERHPDTLISISNLVDLLRETDQSPEARADTANLAAQVAQTAAEVLGPKHMTALVIDAKAARVLIATPGRTAEGEKQLVDAVARMSEALGPGHPQTRKYVQIRDGGV